MRFGGLKRATGEAGRCVLLVVDPVRAQDPRQGMNDSCLFAVASPSFSVATPLLSCDFADITRYFLACWLFDYPPPYLVVLMTTQVGGRGGGGGKVLT